jgi:hypothetical protein
VPWLLLGCAPFLALAIQTRSPEPSASLSLGAADVRDALSWAASASPAPYPLRGTDGRTVGMVYTPYVRLAIAARVARSEGRPIEAEQVRPTDIDPLYGPFSRGLWYLGWLAWTPPSCESGCQFE